MIQIRAFFSFAIPVFIVFFVIAGGCTTPSGGTAGPQQTPLPSAIPSSTVTPGVTSPALVASSPVTTTPVAGLTPASAAVSPLPTTIPSLTSDDVTQHFMDIAFGSGNTQLDRLPYTPTVQKPRNTISLFNGNSADLA